MASASKEENVLKLILENSPLREWHFEEIVRNAKVTRLVANKWLSKYAKIGLIKHIRPKGKFPYFTAGSNNSAYYSQKRVFALEQLHRSGLMAKLLSLNEPKAIIIFGSIPRGDWYKDSDIDIFILGNLRDFNKSIFEERLGRHIELHLFQNKREIRAVKSGLIQNIINGYVIKGQIQDIVEVA